MTLRHLPLLPVLVVSLALGGSVAGCASTDPSMVTDPSMTAAPAAAATTPPISTSVPIVVQAAVPLGEMTMPTAEEVGAAWEARPDFVKQLPAQGQAAYAFALARPDVLQWLPCYCGCGAIPHRSNLDCFFQRREVKGTYQYEEHASFCDICVQTANTASALIRQGQTTTQIRAAIDAQFGGGAAPGTDTALPPA